MSVLELKETREALELKLEGIVSVADAEKRDLTEQESKDFDSLEAQVKSLNERIQVAERMDKYRKVKKDKTVVAPEQKSLGRYSISKAIREYSNGGRLTGLEAEMDQEARDKNSQITHIGIPHLTRATSVGSAASAGNLVATDLSPSIIEALYPDPVIFRAGASRLDGLVGDLEIPKFTSEADGAWEGEVDANASTDPVTTKLSLSPNRYGAFTAISKQLLAQSPLIGDSMIAGFIRRATSRALDTQALIGSGSPITGITGLTDVGEVVADATNGAAVTWQDLIDMESQIFVDNAEGASMKYLMTPGLRGFLKATPKDAGSGMFLATQDGANGYEILTSTLLPSNGTKGTGTSLHTMIFGDFSQMIVGNWANGYDIVVDPYSGSKNAQVNIVVNSWWDIVFRHDESFCILTDADIS